MFRRVPYGAVRRSPQNSSESISSRLAQSRLHAGSEPARSRLDADSPSRRTVMESDRRSFLARGAAATGGAMLAATAFDSAAEARHPEALRPRGLHRRLRVAAPGRRRQRPRRVVLRPAGRLLLRGVRQDRHPDGERPVAAQPQRPRRHGRLRRPRPHRAAHPQPRGPQRARARAPSAVRHRPGTTRCPAAGSPCSTTTRAPARSSATTSASTAPTSTAPAASRGAAGAG